MAGDIYTAALGWKDNSEFSKWLTEHLSNQRETIASKAMDAEYLRTHIGGSWHRLYDGGHTLVGSWNAVRDALPDLDTLDQLGAWANAYWQDLVTARGMPVILLDHTNHVSQYFKHMDSVNVAEVIGDPQGTPTGKTSFQGDIDKALPPSVFSVAARTDPSGDYATTVAMVKARYADLSAQAGQKDYSADRVAAAVTDVTGGVLAHNGGSFIAPARGMNQSQFDSVLAGVTDKDLAGVTTLNGQAVTADYLRSSAQLDSVGDGRYLMRLGRDPAKPIYAYQGATTEMPQKFVLDLRGRQAATVAQWRATGAPGQVAINP